MNSSFPDRWSFSYLNLTKCVTHIIGKPKYKYGQQEQVTVRSHSRSSAKKADYDGNNDYNDVDHDDELVKIDDTNDPDNDADT